MFSTSSRPRGTGYLGTTLAEVPSARVRVPGTLGARAKNWLKMALTGALGILAALVVDLQNRGDSSALFVVARGLVAVAALIGIAQVPLYATIGVLMAAGAAVVLYFRPQGLRPAFMTGFGSLAALMTMVPGHSGEAIGVPSRHAPPGELPVIEQRDLDQASAGRARLAGFASAPEAEDAPAYGYTIAVRMRFPAGVPEPVALRIKQGRLKARLFNPGTGRAYNLFLSAGGPVVRDEDQVLVETTIPARAEQGTLLLRVEADGHAIEVAEAQVRHGENPVWDVELAPTDEPLLWQRLKHTYAF